MKGKTKKSSKTKAGQSEAAAAESPAKAEDEIAALNDRLLRLQADFENFRKRTIREKNELFRRANESILEELLPVLDSMGLAIEGAGNHGAAPALVDGFELVSEQFLSVLGKFGLSPIDAEGQQFDPNLHEAVSHLPSDTVADGHVITQTRRGYMLGEMLLRPAQVVVSSGPVTEDGALSSGDSLSESDETTGGETAKDGE